MKNLKLALVASTVLAASASGVALAATDGTLGLTSEGESLITLIKQNAVQITDVADLNLGTFATATADVVGSDNVCVFSSTGGYNVEIDGSVAGTFELDSAGDKLAYSVTWAANGGAAAAVTAGTPITGLTGDSTSLNCGGGTNATFEVTVAQAAFNAADPGTYTDTLTLTVRPE